MRKVTPFLWFDREAEEAMNFYVSVFKNSRVVSVNRAGGRVMTVNFELDGQPFIGLNAGPHHKFNEAISFFINCETQDEVDMLWERLSEGGAKSQCGSRSVSVSGGLRCSLSSKGRSSRRPAAWPVSSLRNRCGRRFA